MTTVESLMVEAALAIDEDIDRAREFGGIYKFVLDGVGGRTFILDLGEHPRVIDGDGDAECTIYMEASDFIDLMEGRADRRALFFMGRLTVEGDWGRAMKLKDLDELRVTQNGQ
ncbi:SCP2 sterol-binding domain-containing protein [Mycobacterium sp.]|uniref:SCP2 sterol-binding domain-containing protein n=1 Tax=Mycobacterium sp. TaxID=1785 RepID=UPI002C89EA8F|nr:SCP2 sterol-binding domain-containing protein [Mycobacterium sp.]HKP40453.1 SCP2 sterol-binding domain-containing protein [Mycobacterium sp.]